MKHYFSLGSVLLLALGITTFNSCDQTKDPCATWDTQVEPIIASTCAYSGCHSGDTTASPFVAVASNDFTTYAGIKSNLDNGNFVQRVLVNKDMPNAQFVPQGHPTMLTQEQLDLLQCWIDAGYPES